MPKPVLSVIMPSHNSSSTIMMAIESVLQQHYKPLELVVVDDGSSDGTVSLVASVRDDRVRLIRQEHGGVSTARNRGIREAAGRYIGFCDADDELLPWMASELVEQLDRNPDAGAASGAFLEVREDSAGRLPSRGLVLGAGTGRGDVVDWFRTSAHVPVVCTGSVLLRKSLLDQVGLFRTDLQAGEDFELWCRVAGKSRWRMVDKPMMIYFLAGDMRDKLKKRMGQANDWLYNEAMMKRNIDESKWDSFRYYRYITANRYARMAVWAARPDVGRAYLSKLSGRELLGPQSLVSLALTALPAGLGYGLLDLRATVLRRKGPATAAGLDLTGLSDSERLYIETRIRRRRKVL